MFKPIGSVRTELPCFTMIHRALKQLHEMELEAAADELKSATLYYLVVQHPTSQTPPWLRTHVIDVLCKRGFLYP